MQYEVQLIVPTTAKREERLPPQLAQPSPAHATTPAAATLSPAILGGVSSDESHTQNIDDAQALMELTEIQTVGPDLSNRPTYEGVASQAEERLSVESLHVKEDTPPSSLPNNKRDDLDAILVKRQREAQREERRRVASECIMKLERILARTTVSYRNTHVGWT